MLKFAHKMSAGIIKFVVAVENGFAVAYRGGRGLWGSTPPPRNSEGPPKSCQTQPDCENC